MFGEFLAIGAAMIGLWLMKRKKPYRFTRAYIRKEKARNRAAARRILRDPVYRGCRGAHRAARRFLKENTGRSLTFGEMIARLPGRDELERLRPPKAARDLPLVDSSSQLDGGPDDPDRSSP